MKRSPSKPKDQNRPEWASMIVALRDRLSLNQTAFGQELHSSAMAVSRWERGAQEPPAHSYIELGNLAGDPDCWFFWGRAGLTTEDLMRVIPKLRTRLRHPKLHQFQIVRAGTGDKNLEKSQLVAIPLLKVVAGTHGQKGEDLPDLHDAPVESMIAAPKEWCPNPAATNCVRVAGNSMNPIIYDGYILAVDSSQTNRAKLNGKIVIAWHKNLGLTVCRYRRYNHTEVLHPENRDYESTTLDRKHNWKILAKVLWWIGKAD
jgi:SOS-response transcriptional repressor LexA